MGDRFFRLRALNSKAGQQGSSADPGAQASR